MVPREGVCGWTFSLCCGVCIGLNCTERERQRVVVEMDGSRVVDAHQMGAVARDCGWGTFGRDTSGVRLGTVISYVYLILDYKFQFRLLTRSRPAA